MPYFQGTFEERCLTAGAPKQLSFFTTVFSSIFLILNIPGNLLVILAVAMDPHKNLRRPFNYLMANLAVADLMVGAVTDALSIYIHVKEGLRAHLYDAEVKVIHVSYFVSCTASVLSLATLAVERQLATRNPHTYRNEVTGKRILLTIAFIWFVSLTLPLVYFEVAYITYAFIFANTAVIGVFIITCSVYTVMLRKFRRRAVKNEDTETRNEDTTTRSEGEHVNYLQQSVTVSSSNLHIIAVQWERKLTRMFLVVLVAFLCCYGPSTVFIYAMSFCESCSCETFHWFRDLQFLFAIMNSSVNFYCYALRSTRFRRAFVSILRVRRRQHRS